MTANDVGVGLMTDCKEKSVDSDIKKTLVFSAFVFDKVCAFNKFLAKKAYSVGVEKHLDVFFVKYAFLHYL
jgi:hypothetical protein